MGDLPAIQSGMTVTPDQLGAYLAEVGLSDAIAEPAPLAPGPISQRGFDFSIMQTDDGWLRFRNHTCGMVHSFDFRPDYSDEVAISAMLGWLTRHPGSPFTNAQAILRHTPNGYVGLKNDCLCSVTADSTTEKRITSADQLADTFEMMFHINAPQYECGWKKIQTISEC